MRQGARAERLEGQSGKFWALSHPDRLLVLKLTAQPKTLDELAEALGTSRQAVSKHVRVLRAAGLLQERAGRRQREVKEFLADAAEVYALSSDLARLVEARARADELVALPTIAPGPSELRAGAVLRGSPSLVVLRAGEVAARVPLAPSPGSRWVIGRSPRCQIPLGHDKRVSQQHAVVRWDAQRFCIQDLESRNGTFVNGERVASGAARALAPGDILRAGDTALVFQ